MVTKTTGLMGESTMRPSRLNHSSTARFKTTSTRAWLRTDISLTITTFKRCASTAKNEHAIELVGRSSKFIALIKKNGLRVGIYAFSFDFQPQCPTESMMQGFQADTTHEHLRFAQTLEHDRCSMVVPLGPARKIVDSRDRARKTFLGSR